jgi:hypothetical protein
MKINQVLREYQQGDADTRMHLCLYYREFRDEFNNIELDDPMALGTSLKESSSGMFFSPIMDVLHKYAASFFYSH